MRNGRLLVGRMPLLLGVAALLATSSGCAILNGFLDPTKVGQFPLEYQERGIKRVLTPRDNPGGPPNATEPTPEDLVPSYRDYTAAPADVMQITIEDLLGQGLQEISAQQVTDTGYIRLPRVGSFKVVGLTETQIEEEISRRLIESEQLPKPIVRVVLQSRNSRVFYMLGSVGRAGAYPLQRPNMRLLDVIGLAQDIGANVSKLYVIRRNLPDYRDLSPSEVEPDDGELVVPPPGEDEIDGAPIAGMALASYAADESPAKNAAELEALEDVMNPTGAGAPDMLGEPDFPQIIFDPTTGEALEAPPAPAAPRDESSETGSRDGSQPGFDWEDVPEYELEQRVIEIDVAALKAGDPRYNIVVRSEDVINVPIDTGVFYAMGEINRPGVYAFGGREVTVKQAMALVGGLSALAWPQRCEIIRREPGTDTQVTIPINLDAIFAGLEDDVLLRHDDVLNVGTHPISPFLFVIRNSFRFTYGFGFVYDRNFADADAYGARTNPETVERARRQQQGLPF